MLADIAAIPVYLVEPSGVQAKVITGMLAKRGALNVRRFENAGEMLKVSELDPPGLVISALYLPDMQGTELVQRMRTDPALEHTPFVLISSETRPDALGTPDGIMLAQANGSGVSELSNAQGRDIDTAPSWSPDGLRYAYVRMAYLNNAYRPALFVRDIGGSAAVSLASFQDGSLNGTAWSPDGKTIAYARRSASGSGGIYLVAADGSSAASLLVSDSRAQLTPSAWSPDGAKIAFGGDGGIQVVHADGTGLVTLLATSPWPPAWSPDGNDIAFCGGGIRLMKADGSNVRQLWTGNANCDLSWR